MLQSKCTGAKTAIQPFTDLAQKKEVLMNCPPHDDFEFECVKCTGSMNHHVLNPTVLDPTESESCSEAKFSELEDVRPALVT